MIPKVPEKLPARLKGVLITSAVLRRVIASLAVYLGCAAASLLILLVVLLVDRFVETGPTWRLYGGRLAIMIAAGGVVPMLFVLLRPLRLYAQAVRLDCRFPENEDRCATAFDLACRTEAGEMVGDRGQVERVLRDAAQVDVVAQAPYVLDLRPLLAPVLALAGLGVVLLLMHWSNTFDLPLLFARISRPYANLPRDSSLLLEMAEVNGRPVDSQDAQLAPIPSGEPFTLKVIARRKPHRLLFWLRDRRQVPLRRPVRIVLDDPEGSQTHELVRAGEAWLFSRAKLDDSFRFRLWCGLAATRVYTQPVLPRIRITSLRWSARFPRYTKMTNVPEKPLTEDRLAVIEETRLQFELECNEDFAELEVDFEPLQERTAVPAGERVSAKEAWLKGRMGRVKAGPGTGNEEGTGRPRRRLNVRSRYGYDGRFGLRVNESGILRIRAIGKNGLPSRRRVCVIEMVKDTPPRVSVLGLEPDTMIIPGEVVAYQYKAEDDLGVASLIVEWTVAGGATSPGLSGEEYIRSEDFGKKVVQGQELIQRMNYRVYATAPFEFRLRVIDTKGQESVTDQYRIHITSDDFASRFEDAIEFLQDFEKNTQNYQARLRDLSNQLNIMEKAAAGQKRWPATQNQLLADYGEQARRVDAYWSFIHFALYRYGGFPERIDRALGLLLASERMTLRASDYKAMGRRIALTEDLPSVFKAIRGDIAQQKAFTDVVLKAVADEKRRWLPERAYQQARRLLQRLDALHLVKDNRDLYEANLRFYRVEFEQIVKFAEAAAESVPALEAVLPRLRSAREKKTAPALQEATGALVEAMTDHRAPASPGLLALAAQMHAVVRKEPLLAPRATVAVADVLTSRGRARVPRPVWCLQLLRMWTQHAGPSGPDWCQAPASGLEAALVARQLFGEIEDHRRNVIAHRYELNPTEGDDAEAVIRETALVLDNMLRSGAKSPPAFRQALNRLFPALRGGRLRDLLSQSGGRQFSGLVISEGNLRALLQQVDAKRESGYFKQQAERIAAGYDRFADAVTAELARVQKLDGEDWEVDWALFRRQALRLQGRAEALEAACRMLLLLRMQEVLRRRAGPPDWPWWRNLHGAQFGMTLVALNAHERVSYRFSAGSFPGRKIDYRRYSVVAANARDMAADLRRYSTLAAEVALGDVSDRDFTELMKRSGSVGALEALRKEFEALRPFLAGTAGKAQRQEAQEKLRASLFGKVALAECELARLLSKAEADPQKLASLYAKVQLPRVSTLRRQNRRAGQSNQFWTIAARVASHDRRWLTRIRDAELGLVRAWVAQAFPELADVLPVPDLRGQYARLLELRARQVADERRRNRGIALLGEETGPRLKLPKHITVEFFRARTRRPPESFKDMSERYYETLHRDLAD